MGGKKYYKHIWQSRILIINFIHWTLKLRLSKVRNTLECSTTLRKMVLFVALQLALSQHCKTMLWRINLGRQNYRQRSATKVKAKTKRKKQHDNLCIDYGLVDQLLRSWLPKNKTWHDPTNGEMKISFLIVNHIYFYCLRGGTTTEWCSSIKLSLCAENCLTAPLI